MAISQFAFLAPQGATEIISRPRLEDLSEIIAQRRLTVVRAPAGYGKTTLLLDWKRKLAERGVPHLWVALRAGYGGGEDLAMILASGLAQAGFPMPGDGPADADSLLSAIMAAKRGRPVLIVDDAQLLGDEALSFLMELVERGRDLVSVVVSTRGRLPCAIARLRVLGHLLEIGQRELAFDFEEATLLASRINRGPVSVSDVTEALEHSDGWPTGLFWLLRAKEESWPNERLMRYGNEYFEEEVLRLVDAKLRAFLIDLSILRELTPASALAVTGQPDAGETIEGLLESGLFVEEIGELRYKVHPMLRLHLSAVAERTDPRRKQELHRFAALHFEAIDFPTEAMHHACKSDDQIFLADMLERQAKRLVDTSYIWLVEKIAAKLPCEVLAERPETLLCTAWAKSRRLSFAAAEQLIAAAETAIERRRQHSPDDPKLMMLDKMLHHRRIVLAAGRDDLAYVERASEAFLADQGDDDPFIGVTLLAMLMTARRELFHFDDTLRLEAETQRALERQHNDFAAIAFKSSIAPNLIIQGKCAVADQLLTEALADAERLTGKGSSLAALPALALAEYAYLVGDLDRARPLIENYLGAVRQFGFVDHLLSGYLVEARLLVAAGEISQAIERLDAAHLVAIDCGLERLRAGVIAEQVRLLIREGAVDKARRLFEDAKLFTGSAPLPVAGVSRRDETVAIAWIRLELADGALASARRVTRHWLDFVRRRGSLHSVVQFNLLLAQVSVRAGDVGQAARHMHDALTIAAPAGWLQMFLDEGEAVTALVRRAYGDGLAVGGAIESFSARLLDCVANDVALEDGEVGSAPEQLASREAQIVGLVGAGLRNREIGNRLGLTEGTVKWYMQQIYDKLGVRRRAQVVARARQLGLLG